MNDKTRIVIEDELGKLVDNLHNQARVLKTHDHMPEHAAALREAADYLSDVRKEVQRG